MRFLILSQYYPPETGAPQNRLHNMCKHLVHNGMRVSVLTAMPNYPTGIIPKTYKWKLFLKENIDNIEVFRSWIFATKSTNIFFRLMNYFSFVITSFILGLHILKKSHDFIICESPPLFLGITAIFLRKIKRVRLLFNISDLWPRSVEEVGIIKNRLLLSISTSLEEYIYDQSDLITGQTMGIVSDVFRRKKQKRIHWYPNSFDFSTIPKNGKDISYLRQKMGYRKEDFLIIYAGLLGYAQDIETCLEAASLIKDQKVKFLFFGTGPEEKKLLSMSLNLGLNNVKFYGHKRKNDILEILPMVDAGLIPLKNLPIFLGAIPSKIFEILAYKIPLLLGVDGEAKKIFIDQANSGLFFQPGNAKDLKKKIDIMISDKIATKQLGAQGFKYLYENFNQRKVVNDFLSFINSNI